MIVGTVLLAAWALSIERACYVWISRSPHTFRRVCAGPAVAWLGPPIAVVRWLFAAFKLVQLLIFVGWCYVLGGGTLAPAERDPITLGLGSALVLVGQALSGLVFYRLGWVGVFYGDRLGYAVSWCRAFPFSVLPHPQYLGAVLTIWGFFAVMRFPHDDWWWLPAIETVYYVVGTLLEARRATTDGENARGPVDIGRQVMGRGQGL